MTFLLSILSLFALNVLIPGSSFVLTMRSAMVSGLKSGLGVALGLAAADIAYAIAAVLGVSALLEQHESLSLTLAVLGGVWIVYLGLKVYLGPRKNAPVEERDFLAITPLKSFKVGLTAGLANPQALLFFTSVFVAAVAGKLSPFETTMVLLGIAAISVSIRCGIVGLAATERVRVAYLSNKKVIEKVSGVLLVFFGSKLASKAAISLASIATLKFLS